METRHAGFILAAYAVTAAVFALMILRAVLESRAQTRALERLGERSPDR